MYLNHTPMQQEGEPEKKGMPGIKKIATTLGIVVMLAGVGAAGYFYRQLDQIKKNPNKVSQDETRALIDKVGKLIVLPSNEDPTIATVTDLSKLKEQVFFANAKEGDKVLIYTNAKKAILYNPTDNKIVEVAPVNIGDNTANNANSVSGTETENNSQTNQ
jgi:hypothetical protein